MRLVKQIPHERYLIQVHQYNGKFILKIELGGFEQLFKVAESEVNVEQFQNEITNEFLKNCLDRFIAMRADWENILTNKKSNK